MFDDDDDDDEDDDDDDGDNEDDDDDYDDYCYFLWFLLWWSAAAADDDDDEDDDDDDADAITSRFFGTTACTTLIRYRNFPMTSVCSYRFAQLRRLTTCRRVQRSPCATATCPVDPVLLCCSMP